MIEKIGETNVEGNLIELFILPKTREFLEKKEFSKKDLYDYLIEEKNLPLLSKLGENQIFSSEKKGIKIVFFGATEGTPQENLEKIEDEIPKEFEEGMNSVLTIHKNYYPIAVMFFKITGVKLK